MRICDRTAKSRRSDEVIAALLTYATIKEAAAAVGLHQNTVLGYLRDERFTALYTAARRSVLGVAMARLQACVGEAVETLRSVMVDGEAPASSRVSAARAVLEMSAKFVEHEELLGRLEALEAAFGKERGVN